MTHTTNCVNTTCVLHLRASHLSNIFFFFNDTATTEIYTLSLHDALPISRRRPAAGRLPGAIRRVRRSLPMPPRVACAGARSEEHTSELQSQSNLVCRLLLEKKKIHDHQNGYSRAQRFHL